MATRRKLRNSAVAILVVLLNIDIIQTKSIKTSLRPVHEVINEQARIDTKINTSKTPENIPYGNPLLIVGNTQPNARQHAQNQQAMFNAERIRQHRAQLQRWTKAPIQVDSYMKAYHESLENHHMALEQQQTDIKGITAPATPVTSPPPRRPDSIKRGIKPRETIKITKADAINPEKNRNHRSHGSVDQRQYLSPKRYQTVYLSPGTTYDQGVTIKPHGTVGLSQMPHVTPPSKLYTEAIPSKTQYVHPKQHTQMHQYQTTHDIDTLNTLLHKEPKEQLSELTALLQSSKQQEESKETSINTPIDLYFYMKDPLTQTLTQQFEPSHYAQIPLNYASAYTAQSQPTQIKDHTPITEHVDDIEDPNANNRIKPISLQPVLIQQNSIETTTTKNNNYYKVEVASQTISSGYKTPKPVQYNIDGIGSQYAAAASASASYNYPIHTTSQPTYVPDINHEDNTLSQKYLHHNAQHTGIQHLTQDGTGIPAYDDDNLQYASNYEFGYRVHDTHSGNDFGHHEEKTGEKTNGQYHVLLPDGRLQKVHYSAGPEGFHANISYDHLQYQKR